MPGGRQGYDGADYTRDGREGKGGRWRGRGRDAKVVIEGYRILREAAGGGGILSDRPCPAGSTTKARRPRERYSGIVRAPFHRGRGRGRVDPETCGRNIK